MNTDETGLSSFASFCTMFSEKALLPLDSAGRNPTRPSVTLSFPEDVTLNEVPLTEAVATGERILNPTFFPLSFPTLASMLPESMYTHTLSEA